MNLEPCGSEPHALPIELVPNALLNSGQVATKVSNLHHQRHGLELYQFELVATWAPLTECHSLEALPRWRERNLSVGPPMGLLKLRAGHPKFPWGNPTAIAGNHSLGESNPKYLSLRKSTTVVMRFR